MTETTKNCPYCGEEVLIEANKCKHCKEWLNSKPQTQVTNYMDDIPTEIRGWNWGAFGFSWIWGLVNNSYLTLLTLIPFFGFIWVFVCGAKGNEWAWENKKWTSIEEFHRVQRLWAKWSAIIFGGSIAIILIMGVIIIIISPNSLKADINEGQNASQEYAIDSDEEAEFYKKNYVIVNNIKVYLGNGLNKDDVSKEVINACAKDAKDKGITNEDILSNCIFAKYDDLEADYDIN